MFLKKLVLFVFVSFFWIVSVFSNYNQIDLWKKITYEEAYFFLFDNLNVPESYKFIDLKYSNLLLEDEVYSSLQKGVYLDILKNIDIKIPLEKKISYKDFISLFEKSKTWLSISENAPQNWYVTVWDLINLTDSINNINEKTGPNFIYPDKFLDVYSTILNEYNYIDEETLKLAIDWAINWFIGALWDKYTKFYPKKEKQDLASSLTSEKYYWIWAYIAKKGWEFYFTDTIKTWPSHLKIMSWDKIVIVDSILIPSTYSLKQVSELIKWPEWTEVKLILDRKGKKKELTIKRRKVEISHSDYAVYLDKTLVLKSSVFDDSFSTILRKALVDFEDYDWENIVFDLRWNSWWIVEEASKSLWYFIEEWKKTFYIKYANWELKNYYSYDDYNFDLSSYDVYFLVDSKTASAAEIFTISLKEYFPEIKIFGEKTYWKWTVQKILEYDDSTAIKYTAWEWFSPFWKTINKVWIKPDFWLENLWEKNIIDYIIQIK